MNLRQPRLVFSNLSLAATLILSGCAAQPNTSQVESAAEQEDFNDPLEDTNRKIFDFNQVVDRNVLVPIAKTYRTVLPDPVRDSLRDFLRNLREPLIFVNDAFQGDFERAGQTFARFALNSTVGLAGFVDVVGPWGHLPFPEEVYLVIPVLGPSNPRDLVGQVGEGFGDPWTVLVTGNPYNLRWIPFVR